MKIGDADDRPRALDQLPGVGHHVAARVKILHLAVAAVGEPAVEEVAVGGGLRLGDAGEGEAQLVRHGDDVALCGRRWHRASVSVGVRLGGDYNSPPCRMISSHSTSTSRPHPTSMTG